MVILLTHTLTLCTLRQTSINQKEIIVIFITICCTSFRSSNSALLRGHKRRKQKWWKTREEGKEGERKSRVIIIHRKRNEFTAFILSIYSLFLLYSRFSFLLSTAAATVAVL
jgi:hypothetical protein